jgi:hypothetical protein
MNTGVSKIGDAFLCIMGTIFIMTVFAVIVIAEKPGGALSHCPIKPFTATVSYTGGEK